MLKNGEKKLLFLTGNIALSRKKLPKIISTI